MPKNVLGTIYLLHFNRPYKHAKHYLGWASNLEKRLSEHASGRGARLLEIVAAEGITWKLARTWEGDRYRGRAFKKRGKAQVCPICQARKKVSTMLTKDWRDRAACRDVDPGLFFPMGDVFAKGEDRAAKVVCRHCPVKAECLSWAMSIGLTHGIAGGMTETERRALRQLAS